MRCSAISTERAAAGEGAAGSYGAPRRARGRSGRRGTAAERKFRNFCGPGSRCSAPHTMDRNAGAEHFSPLLRLSFDVYRTICADPNGNLSQPVQLFENSARFLAARPSTFPLSKTANLGPSAAGPPPPPAVPAVVCDRLRAVRPDGRSALSGRTWNGK